MAEPLTSSSLLEAIRQVFSRQDGLIIIPITGVTTGRIYQANGERNYIEFGRYQPVQTRSTNALYAWSTTITELSPSATKFQGCLGRSFSSAEMVDELAESVYSGKDGVEEDSALHTCLWKDSDEESAIQGPT